MSYSYPSNNTYFEAGARMINEKLNDCGIDNFLFIDFRSEHIISLLPSNILIKKSNRYVIMLSCSELMPLALYYIKNDYRFNILFDSSASIDSIINSLKTYEAGNLIMIMKALSLVCLTKDEVEIFDLYAYLDKNNLSYNDLLECGVENKKKYYRLTKSIAHKLKKRRFSSLFYNSN